MLRTVDRSLETGVRDTSDEWRRYTSKKLLDESFSEMVQGDVERERGKCIDPVQTRSAPLQNALLPLTSFVYTLTQVRVIFVLWVVQGVYWAMLSSPLVTCVIAL